MLRARRRRRTTRALAVANARLVRGSRDGKARAFRRIVAKDGSIVEVEKFDLGIAVALEGDRLATAVVHAAATLDWTGFAVAYGRAIAEARSGKLEEVQAPLNITSLGAFGVEVATPIVVPPAMATLFIGKAHERMINDGGAVYPAESSRSHSLSIIAS